MGNKYVEQLVIVTKPALTANLTTREVALFTGAGAAYVPMTTASNVMAHQAVFAGADVTALKVELNALRTKMLNAGLMAAA